MEKTEAIQHLLLQASSIANEYFGKVEGITKQGDNNQVLTKADLAIGSFLIQEIEKQFPTHNIIDEETGGKDKQSPYTWVIDPIDGTSNFASGIATYGIYVGLLHEGVPVAGGLCLPAFEKIYIAEKGKGTRCNNTRCFVSQEEHLASTLVAYQIDGHQEAPEKTHDEMNLLEKTILHIRNLRISNSAFDCAMVVEGRYGGILNQTSKIWDNVAQQILIEEAGGIYTDFFGNPIEYGNPMEKIEQNFTYCGAAPQLHAQLQKILR